jgi:hypothetical protein
MSFKNVVELSAKKISNSDTKQVNAADIESKELSIPDLGAAHPETGLRYSGFFPMRCLFFSPEVMKTLAPGECVLFLYLTFLAWRYPAKDGCVRAALPYLVSGVGGSRASVHRHLQRLEKLGYIERLETNYKIGNLYRIAEFLFWSDGKPAELPTAPGQKSQETAAAQIENKAEEPSQNETTQIEHAQNNTAAVSKRDGRSIKIGLHPSQNETEDYTSLNSSILSYSHSTNESEEQEILANYFSSIKAYKKKKSEKNHYAKLRENFEISEIADALDFLLGYGVPGTGEKCHSPMSYLSVAMGEIQQTLKEKAEKTDRAEAVKHQREVFAKAEAEKAADQEAEFKKELAAFERAFPSKQAREQFFLQFAKDYPCLPRDGKALRNLGVSAWWTDQCQKNGQNLSNLDR